MPATDLMLPSAPEPVKLRDLCGKLYATPPLEISSAASAFLWN